MSNHIERGSEPYSSDFKVHFVAANGECSVLTPWDFSQDLGILARTSGPWDLKSNLGISPGAFVPPQIV